MLQPEALEAAITPRTRLLLLNYPNNPSGAACDAAALAAIAEVLRRHPDIWVLSDDIYEHLLFDDFRYATLAAVAPDLAERIVTMTGVSKTYAMTGWRIGFCAGPAALIKAMTVVQATATSGVSSVGQAAALAALEGPQDYLGGTPRRLPGAARSGRGAAARGAGPVLPQAGRRVLCVSGYFRLHRQNHAGRNKNPQRR